MPNFESLSPYLDIVLLASLTSFVLYILGNTYASITYFLTQFYLWTDDHLNFSYKWGEKISNRNHYDSFFLKVGKTWKYSLKFLGRLFSTLILRVYLQSNTPVNSSKSVKISALKPSLRN